MNVLVVFLLLSVIAGGSRIGTRSRPFQLGFLGFCVVVALSYYSIRVVS